MKNNVTHLRPEKLFQHPDLPDFLTRRMKQYFTRVRNSCGNRRHLMRGGKPGRNALHLSSNDYLSIAQHPLIRQAMADSVQREGNGVLMSGIYLSSDCPQLALELRLAEFMQAQSGVLCQSGYAANTGLIQAIANEHTPVYADMMVHMSLWDGVRAAGAKAIPCFHNDAEHFERQILRHGPGIVMVDSIYSTSGRIAPLRELVAICEAQRCILVVDESHSMGTHGPDGAGLVVEYGLAEKVHFRTISLAKAFTGRAGFVTCTPQFNEYFKCTSNPAIFSSTLLPHDIAGLDAALDVIRNEGWRRTKLHENAAYLRKALDELGYNLNDSESQIISLEAGPEQRTIVLRDALEARGIFGSPFCDPATPKNRSLMRLSINASLTDADLDRIITVCRDIRDEVDLANWPSTRRKQRRKATVETLPTSEVQQSQSTAA